MPTPAEQHNDTPAPSPNCDRCHDRSYIAVTDHAATFPIRSAACPDCKTTSTTNPNTDQETAIMNTATEQHNDTPAAPAIPTVAALKRALTVGTRVTLTYCDFKQERIGRTREVAKTQSTSIAFAEPKDKRHGLSWLNFPKAAEFRAEPGNAWSFLNPATGLPALSYRIETGDEVAPVEAPAMTRAERAHPYADQLTPGDTFRIKRTYAEPETVTVLAIETHTENGHEQTVVRVNCEDSRTQGQTEMDPESLADPTRATYIGRRALPTFPKCATCADRDADNRSAYGEECGPCSAVRRAVSHASSHRELAAILAGTGRVYDGVSRGADRFKPATPEFIAEMRRRFPAECDAAERPVGFTLTGNRDAREEEVAPFLPAFRAVKAEMTAAGKYPYNDSFRGKVAGIAGPDEDTVIYVLQGLARDAEAAEKEAALLADGYIIVRTGHDVPEGRRPKSVYLRNGSGQWFEFNGTRLVFNADGSLGGALCKGYRRRGMTSSEALVKFPAARTRKPAEPVVEAAPAEPVAPAPAGKTFANIRIERRTFEALNHPKGSAERAELNREGITSEYSPSVRYSLVCDVTTESAIGNEQPGEGKLVTYETREGFRTKREAELTAAIYAQSPTPAEPVAAAEFETSDDAGPAALTVAAADTYIIEERDTERGRAKVMFSPGPYGCIVAAAAGDTITVVAGEMFGDAEVLAAVTDASEQEGATWLPVYSSDRVLDWLEGQEVKLEPLAPTPARSLAAVATYIVAAEKFAAAGVGPTVTTDAEPMAALDDYADAEPAAAPQQPAPGYEEPRDLYEFAELLRTLSGRLDGMTGDSYKGRLASDELETLADELDDLALNTPNGGAQS